jgi:hypothetical protein
VLMEENVARVAEAKSTYIKQTNINKDKNELKTGSILLNFFERGFVEGERILEFRRSSIKLKAKLNLL